MILKVNQPATFYISFTGETPRKFELENSNGEVYFFRFLDGKTKRIKINVLHVGTYLGNVPFEVVKSTTLEIPKYFPELPAPERADFKQFTIVDNPNLLHTPARIFRKTGVIEKGAAMYDYPKPIRVFILLHEIGHFYYKTEEKCDLFALVHYLKMGYNRSMAFYALSRVLKRSDENAKRVLSLLNNIQKTQSKLL